MLCLSQQVINSLFDLFALIIIINHFLQRYDICVGETK